MKLQGVLFLAAFTSRSKAYAQAMAKANLDPENVVLFGDPQGSLPGQTREISKSENNNGLLLPNLEETLMETSDKQGWHYKQLAASHVNDLNIEQIIKETSPEMIIYSGYGSQIVPSNLLSLGIPFLHIHSGWLPEYRGSTTLYYSWLNDNECGASAILLRDTIDTGPIVRKRKYLVPAKDVDPDYLYDSAIRADLLVQVLKEDYLGDGEFKNVEPQPFCGEVYYVIHPVLKHLARLRT